ncbi:ketoreductase [Saccharomycopsis crataegensis]|uniref:Very-long-chain 3-oxoacyl-CoA reductase n=1 Tax=Saccharomycopsis crataegensis TaxID=43959 RepID=A0AAV5QG51_9ASCO|nr:ketoreductase [Saccharomycopsis crataegensis]
MTFFSSLSNAATVYPCLNYVYYVAFALGLAKLTTVSLSFASLLLDLFVVAKTDFAPYGSKNHTWAIVTGASDGLGKEFAYQLAKKGFNVLLVSRTPSTLQQLSEEIATKYSVKSLFYAMDFSDATALDTNIAGLQKLINDEKLPVSVLINNVGKSHSIPVPFSLTTKDELTDIITINNLATLKFTQAVIPTLDSTVHDSKLSKKSLILTVGSFSGLLPTPMLATYSGSKAFLQNWSVSLAAELKPRNIDVYVVLAYLITSKMSKIRRSSASIPTPKQFVTSTLNNFQKRCGAQERFMTVTPYWSHALMHWAIESTVGVYSSVANKLNYNMHVSIRNRALKKAAKKAKST